METKLSDEWQTPLDLFNVLDKGGEYQGMKFEGFNFGIDLCATFDNFKCDVFGLDYLEDNYYIWGASNGCYPEEDTVCFMNPPYSNPKLFIEKAWEDSKHCRIVCLVKCDPSTQWWATFWNYFPIYYEGEQKRSNIKERAGPKPGCDYLFFPKRIKFDPPQQLIDSGDVWQLPCNYCDNGAIYEWEGYSESAAIESCTQCNGAGKQNKWVQKCNWCDGIGQEYLTAGKYAFKETCHECKGRGYKELSGPTFPSALLIFDRRNL